MTSLINDTLDLWREAERELEALPTASPEYELAAAVVADLRETYARMTAKVEMTPGDLDAIRAHLHANRRRLSAIRCPRPAKERSRTEHVLQGSLEGFLIELARKSP